MSVAHGAVGTAAVRQTGNKFTALGESCRTNVPGTFNLFSVDGSPYCFFVLGYYSSITSIVYIKINMYTTML